MYYDDDEYVPEDESILSKRFKLESEIRATKQGDRSIDEVYEVMVGLWDQIEKLEPFPLIKTPNYEQNHLVQFLLALRDEFEPFRKQLLSRIFDIPSLEESVNLLKNEERKLRSSSRYSKAKFTIDKDDKNAALLLSKLSSLSMNAKGNQDSDFSKGMLGNVGKFAAASIAVAGASWALSDYFAGSGHSSPKDLSKREGLLLPECSHSGKVRILSYNVCFWDLELHERMDALGNLIKLHSPDVICFQEVTSDIYTIFSHSNWWDDYKSSLSIQDTSGRSYFCIQELTDKKPQLSRLPIRSFSHRPFRNSRMGRELCIADIEVSSKTTKSLIIATSHLESPTPAPPTYNQMNSEERVVQAKEALNQLHRYPNVIFCGDMNWDETTDGNFPMFEGWSDAWTDLRPRENGWTYDTKSNQMLIANRPLQKRLDRFVCQMEDFKVGAISMVGTEAIPGVTYSKEKRVRNRMQTLQLPVFPSDHYGLLLEIHSK